MSRPGGRDRRGAALLGVLLLALAATALANGLLLLARFEHAAARAGAEQLRARLAGEGAVRLLLRRPFDIRWQAAPLWAVVDSTSGVVPGGRYEATLTRASREVWLAEGGGTAGRVRTQRAARLVWSLEPAARAAAWGGVVVHAPGARVLIDGTVDASGVAEGPELLPPDGCDAWDAALDSLLPAGPYPRVTELPASAAGAIGLLTLEAAADRIPVGLEGSGTPVPEVIRGECVDAPWSWGGDPCSEVLVARHATGALEVRGGQGQGLVVVVGDLLMVDTTFRGALVVGGRATFVGAASVDGLVRAVGGVSVGDSAALRGSACWAAAALAAADLSGLLDVPGATWIGPF